uniref:Mitochondrial ribonuclease P catalytic subunit n=1 Tax=Nothoprocta perdicaria TaxID=30464 RepID=A0A8C6Z8X2_NOTPE
MAFFSQTGQQGMQALLGKCRIIWPVIRCQQLFAASLNIPIQQKFNCLSFMASDSTALPVNSKGVGVFPAKKRSQVEYEGGTRWDEESKEISEGKLHLFSGASKKKVGSQALLKRRFIRVQPPEKPLQAEEWKKLREECQSLETFEEVMLKSMIKCNSHVDVAKSLLTYVAKTSGDIGYNLLVKYLALCVQQQKTAEICDVYDIMKMRFKTLESGAYSLLIRGLSNSDKWRMALALLEDVKKVMTPSRTSYESCIKAASRHQEMSLARELYHDMLAKDLVPTLDVLQAFFDFSRGMEDADLKKELFDILLYLRDNQIYPHGTFMRSIKLWFESIPGENWRGNLTNIKPSGECPVCHHQLEDSNLTEEEYNILKERITADVIHGRDTFRKTSPQEFEAFQAFVEDRLPFDIVIDGLNVSHVKPKKIASWLFHAINCLAKENVRLLVLGRKHMLVNSSNWKQDVMKEMQNKADFFFAENISEDDTFLLYATLRSGKHCRFVTRDFLRDHKACLSDSLTRRLFRKWQRGHQIVLAFPGIPAFNYDCVVQTTGDTWHIPYKDMFEEKYSYQVPRKWLCLQQKQ